MDKAEIIKWRKTLKAGDAGIHDFETIIVKELRKDAKGSFGDSITLSTGAIEIGTTVDDVFPVTKENLYVMQLFNRLEDEIHKGNWMTPDVNRYLVGLGEECYYDFKKFEKNYKLAGDFIEQSVEKIKEMKNVKVHGVKILR